jgi:charged multivesicular body protein 5
MTMMGQSFNLEQANFAVESLRGTQAMVGAMSDGAKTMKQQMKSINVNKVEDLRDTMEDLLMETEEINEILGRSYGTPEYVDEADLEAELSALGALQGVAESPSYLDQLPSAPSMPASSESKEDVASTSIASRKQPEQMSMK